MSSTWNYRVMRHEQEYGDQGEISVTFAIHEVYYKDKSVNDLEVASSDVGYTKNPVVVSGESVDELRESLGKMLAALDKPVLEYK